MENGVVKKWAVYTIRSRDKLRKSVWIRVGIAFLNGDGSYNIYLDASPLDGKLQMREWKEEPAQVPTNGAAQAEGASAQTEAQLPF